MGVLDILFPKKCVNCGVFGDFVCAKCFPYLSFDVRPMCLVCNRNTYNGLTHLRCHGRSVIDGAFASIVFGRVAKKLVYKFKYRPYLSSLCSFMADLMYEGLIQHETFMKLNLEKAILVPIPLHSSKLRQRGYNQAEMLGQDLAKKFSLQLKNGLQRIRNTDSQTTLDRKKRQENIKGAFVVLESYVDIFKGKTILLIDDVLTSGATLSEAARVLKKNGAGNVYGITLAHGQ